MLIAKYGYQNGRDRMNDDRRASLQGNVGQDNFSIFEKRRAVHNMHTVTVDH